MTAAPVVRLTTLPFLSPRSFKKPFVLRKVPRTLVSCLLSGNLDYSRNREPTKSDHQPSSGTSLMAPAFKAPALLIKTSAWPNVSLTFSHRAATDLESKRLVGTARTWMSLLISLISFVTSASASDERATSTMPFGPLRANDKAKPLNHQYNYDF